MKRYNNIQLDGKPMEVKIVGMVTATSAVMSPYGCYGLRRFVLVALRYLSTVCHYGSISLSLVKLVMSSKEGNSINKFIASNL